MSLAHDRAEAIMTAIEADRLPRQVFVMGPEFLVCRIVAVPGRCYPRLARWVRNQARADVGEVAPGCSRFQLQQRIEAAMDVP